MNEQIAGPMGLSPKIRQSRIPMEQSRIKPPCSHNPRAKAQIQVKKNPGQQKPRLTATEGVDGWLKISNSRSMSVRPRGHLGLFKSDDSFSSAFDKSPGFASVDDGVFGAGSGADALVNWSSLFSSTAGPLAAA